MDFASRNLNWYFIFFYAGNECLICLEVSYYDTLSGFLGQELGQSGRKGLSRNESRK